MVHCLDGPLYPESRNHSKHGLCTALLELPRSNRAFLEGTKAHRRGSRNTNLVEVPVTPPPERLQRLHTTTHSSSFFSRSSLRLAKLVPRFGRLSHEQRGKTALKSTPQRTIALSNMVLIRRTKSLQPSLSTADPDWEEELEFYPYDNSIRHDYPSTDQDNQFDFDTGCDQNEVGTKVVVVLEFPPGFALSDGPPDLLGPNHNPDDPVTCWIQETGSAVSTLSPCSCRYNRLLHHSPVCPVAPNQPVAFQAPPKASATATNMAQPTVTGAIRPTQTAAPVVARPSTMAPSKLSRSPTIEDRENRPMMVPQETTLSNHERMIPTDIRRANRRRSNSEGFADLRHNQRNRKFKPKGFKMLKKTAGRARKAMGIGKIRNHDQEQEPIEQPLDEHTQLDTTCLPIPARATTANSFGQPKGKSSFWSRSRSKNNSSKKNKFSMPEHELM